MLRLQNCALCWVNFVCYFTYGVALVAFLATGSYAVDYGVPVKTIILKFEENQLVSMPAVRAGHIRIETTSGSVVIDDLPGVFRLEHAIKVAHGALAVEGPYRVTMMASEYDKIQLPVTSTHASIEYIGLDEQMGLAGENVKAWFPPAPKDICTIGQSYWHLSAAVTASDTLDGECAHPKNQFAFDRDADMPQAWGITQGSADVLVAVLDTGFDWKHPEFGAEFVNLPISPTTADSLYSFNTGVFYTNTNDPLGDASGDPIPVPGLPEYDDDGDGLEDEDSLGRNWYNDAETDVAVGVVDSVAGTTIYDNSANWTPGSLENRLLYLVEGSVLGKSVRIQSNTAVSVTTDSIYYEFEGQYLYTDDDWGKFFNNDPTYRIGDGLNNNEVYADEWVDDEGWLNDLPNDDDENGAEDDVHGYDFTDTSKFYNITNPCSNEDYYDVDNDVFALGSHGSGMASLIATTLTNGEIMGAAPNVKILPVRVGFFEWDNDAGRCDEGGVNIMSMTSGINYAMTFNPDIIVTAVTASATMASDFYDAIQSAVDSGVVYINGVGNDGAFLAEHWIEEIDPAIAVGGTDQWDKRWDDSQGRSNYGEFVSVSARAAALKIPVQWGNGYDVQSGTSFAGPIVAGIAALVKSAYPHMERDDIIWMIKRGVDPVQAVGDTLGWMGTGRVNGYRALTLYGNVAADADTSWTNELWIGGDVHVPATRTLTIKPGTVVNVAIDDLLKTGNSDTDVEFVIDGQVVILGEPGNPVLFKTYEDTSLVTQYTSTTIVSPSTFTMDSLPAQIAEDAHYAIAAVSNDTTTVLAVEVMSAAGLDSIKVNTIGIGVSGQVTLKDDGVGEDSAAGDGVFTSQRIQANKPEGNYFVTVQSWTNSGAVATQSVTVEAVANKAKFIDVSASTDDLYSLAPTDTASTPYAAVYFSSNPNSVSTQEFLVVTVDDNTKPPLFMEKTFVDAGAPLYQDRTNLLLDTAIPSGSRGVSFADYDSDGDNDFFICGVNSAALYENRLDEIEGTFVDVTTAVFGSSAVDLAGSVAASWGDYNRDGFIDLFVATTSYSGAVRSLNSPTSQQYETMVFRNSGFKNFIATPYGASGSSNVCLSGCWVDLDHDDDLELVTVEMDGAYPSVYENTGFSQLAGDTELVSGNWSTTGVANGAGSISVIDYNHDEYPDLLITEVAAPGRAMILKNDFDGTPSSKTFTAVELASGQAWSGALVADFDLNGQEDYLLLPKSGEAALYMGETYSSSPQYRDLAYTLGLRAGAVSGAIAGDFNGDNDPDLYLGRLKSEQFQYKNVRQNSTGNDAPDAQQKWISVQLETTGSSNGGLIGTAVSIHAGSQSWTQYVDGGSGRGGQRPSRLLFGLGDIAQNQVLLNVQYPSGEIDSMTVAVNNSFTLTENESVVLKAGTKSDPEPDFEFELGPGYTNWIFKWRSTNVKGDLRHDVVHVENHNGYSSQDDCYIGIDSGTPRDLAWGDTGVSHFVYWDGTYWQHVAQWAIPCSPGCDHRFSVTSSSGNGSSVTSGLRTTTPTPICLPEIEN